MNIGRLQEQYIVIEAEGVSDLEACGGELRLLDNELETGVQALYDNENETIVAFVFSRSSFDEQSARQWVKEAEKTGVNLSVDTGLPDRKGRPTFSLASARPISTAIEDMTFDDVRMILQDALEGGEVTTPDGEYRWPWLVDVFVDHCVVGLGPRYYKVPYTLDDTNRVTFGGLQEVKKAYLPVGSEAAVAAGVEQGTARVFSFHLRDPLSLPAGVGDDGLIWKEIFHVSTTFRPVSGDPLVIEQGMIDGLYESFGSRVLNQVPITASTHHEERDGIVPANDTIGFVEKLVKVGKSLFAGLDIRDEDTRDKLDKALIKDCSVYVWADFHDRKRKGKVWDWVLVHLLLTNYPQLPDLQGFGVAPEAIAASYSGVEFTHYMEESMSEPKETNTDQTPPLSEEDAALLAKAKELQAAGFALDSALERQAKLRRKARGLEVDSIIAALEGRTKREDVITVSGHRHYPAVVAAVEKALRHAPASIAADINDEGTSPLDAIVLAIANALPAEARIQPDSAPARPSRAVDAVPEPGEEKRHRTEQLPSDEVSRLSDTSIEEFDRRIGGS
jgi:hypothetical protein